MASEVKNLVSILKKMKAEVPDKKTSSALRAAIFEAAKAGKSPAGVTPDEVKVLKSMGFELEEEAADKPPRKKKARTAEDKAKAKAEGKPKKKPKTKDAEEPAKPKKKLKDGKAEDKGTKASDDDEAKERIKRGAAKQWLHDFFKANKSVSRGAVFKAYNKEFGEKSQPTCGNYLMDACNGKSPFGWELTKSKTDEGKTIYKRGKKVPMAAPKEPKPAKARGKAAKEPKAGKPAKGKLETKVKPSKKGAKKGKDEEE